MSKLPMNSELCERKLEPANRTMKFHRLVLSVCVCERMRLPKLQQVMRIEWLFGWPELAH